MEHSIEYRTVVNLRKELRISFRKNTKDLADSFNCEGLVDANCLEMVFSIHAKESDKSDHLALKVVDSIKLNGENYHVMMAILSKEYILYKDIIKKLNKKYKELGGKVFYATQDEAQRVFLPKLTYPSYISEKGKRFSYNLDHKFYEILKQIHITIDNERFDISKISWIFEFFHKYSPIYEGRKEEDFDVEDIRSSSTLMNLLVRYCSFFNFQIVEDLINLLKNKDLKESMESYKKEFTDYLNEITVAETPRNLGICSGEKLIFAVLLDDGFRKCKQYYLNILKEDVKRILKIDGKVMLFDCVQPGSIWVVFHFPVSFRKTLHIEDHHLKQFKDVKFEEAIILQIQIDDKKFKIHEEAGDQSSNILNHPSIQFGIDDGHISSSLGEYIDLEWNDLGLVLCLKSCGFTEIKYWLKYLQEEKISSIKSLDKHAGDTSITSKLIKHVKSNSDQKALFLLFQIEESRENRVKQDGNFDFENFFDFLKGIIEDPNTSQISSFHENVSAKIVYAIQSLRSHYQQMYEDVLIVALIHHYLQCKAVHQTINLGVTISLPIIKELLLSFTQSLSSFKAYQKRGPLYLQSYLLNLAITIAHESELNDFLKEIYELMQRVEPPLIDLLSSKLDKCLHGKPIHELLEYLKSIIESPELDIKAISKSLPCASKNTSKDDIMLHYTEEGIDLLDKLGLSVEYKLTIKDSLSIKSKIIDLSNQGYCTDPKELPQLVLYKLMSYDSSCRSDLLQKVHATETDIYDMIDEDGTTPKDGIHPVDSLLALLICSDNFLRQDLFSRLAKCQMALPFLLPNPFNQSLIFPIWAMRSILYDWKVSESEQYEQYPIVKYPMPIVSFIRFGENTSSNLSKSRIMNKVIKDDGTNRYFHYNLCPEQYKRVFSEGLVDICWYLPGGGEFEEPIAFLNLHGDAHHHLLQAKFISEISSLCFVMLSDNYFKIEKEDMEIFKQLNKSHPGIIILNAHSESVAELKKTFESVRTINLMTKTEEKIKIVLRKSIKSNIVEIKNKLSIEDLRKLTVDGIAVDEDDDYIRSASCDALKIIQLITNPKVNKKNFKKEMLPLQGEGLWMKWAHIEKEKFKLEERGDRDYDEYLVGLETKQRDIRAKQKEHIDSLPVLVKTFITSLIKYRGHSKSSIRKYYMQTLKQELHFNSICNEGQKAKEYEKLKEKLSCMIKEDKQDDRSVAAIANEMVKAKEDSAKEIIVIKNQLASIEEEIIKSSIGLEHLLREVGQIYEATYTSEKYKGYCEQLSEIVAELIIDGYPLELMDGDAAHVPTKWIQAIFSKLIKELGNKHVFVLSILGIQSSGKSTMLNTTFGLQFKVSAGKCTRGAFMQLLPLGSDLRERTNYSYILVVDTEGLRAQELDPFVINKHDNMLATFVIGLANMTLINIFGEVPGDIEDILQTSVHAFMRMAEVNFSPSCLFIHQNATQSVKTDLELEKFTNNLNKCSVAAAQEEKLEWRYRCFNDIIKFDKNRGIYYFKQLWKGDPPMAAVNLGYSLSAQALKHHIILALPEKASQRSVNDHTIASFQGIISRLWDSLLGENFVFNFKSTVEITAYNALEKSYAKLELKYRLDMQEWKHGVENKISAVKDLASLSEVVSTELKNLKSSEKVARKQYKKKLEENFGDKLVMQWKKIFEKRFQKLAEVQLLQAEDCLKRLQKSKEGITDFELKSDQLLRDIEQQMQENIKSLKSDLHKSFKESIMRKELNESQIHILLGENLLSNKKIGVYKASGIREKVLADVIALQRNDTIPPEQVLKIFLYSLQADEIRIVIKQLRISEKTIKDTFDEIWIELTSKVSRPKFCNPDQVENLVNEGLLDFATAQGYHGQLLQMVNKLPLKKWKYSRIDFPTELKHYSVSSDKLWEKGMQLLNKKIMPSNLFNVPNQIVATVLHEVADIASNICSKNTEFDTIFVLNLLHEVDKKLQNYCSLSSGYTITFFQHYKLQIYIRACSYAIPYFEAMADDFRKKKDPIEIIKNKRNALFTKFKNQYRQTETEVAVAENFCAYIETPIRDQVRKALGTIMPKKMIHYSQHLTDKSALKVKILLDLYLKNDFESFMVYVTDVKTSLMLHIKQYTIEFCDKKSSKNDQTELQLAAEEETSKLIGILSDIVSKLSREAKNLQELLLKLCNSPFFPSKLGTKPKPGDLYDDIQTISEVNLVNLKNEMIKQLQVLEECVLKSMSRIQCISEIDHWEKQLHDIFYSSLIGCTAQCPFCGQQCDLTEHDEKSTPHSTSVHRINCLGGWRDSETQIMATGFCPERVGSNYTFITENHQKHPYKEYKLVFPNWSIVPNPTSKSTLYWKWFISKYKVELAKIFDAKPAEVPSLWSTYTWEAIKDDLQTVYNVQFDEPAN